MIYFIAFKCCDKQCICSAADIKERLQVHKGDSIAEKMNKCEVVYHLLNVFRSTICKIEHLQVYLIIQVIFRKW